MSRITPRFQALREVGRTALIPFVTAGDPNPEVTVPLMHSLVAAGADLIELGVPFSDPMADGPVIQRASERALAQGMSLRRCLDLVRAFRDKDNETPVILMGYLNPIEVMGYEAFAAAAAEAGVDGALTVDLPPEEGHDLLEALRTRDLDSIYLLAPTSREARIRKVCAAASGFVYYVSIKGVTGAGHLDLDSVQRRLKAIRAATDLPLGVGFGIKDPATAGAMGALADAVIVGSALVARIEALVGRPEDIPGELAGFLAELRGALETKA